MKISICIPIYNFDVRALVHVLRDEIQKQNIDAEIILIDDASTPTHQVYLKEIKNSVDRLIILKENIGRSRIRNLFLNHTIGEYLLFLDCDSKIEKTNFVSDYNIYLEENPLVEVVYGGRVNPQKQPSLDYSLRHRFGEERENKSVLERNKDPYLSFQTNNFLIKREVLQNHPFDEKLKLYGYEDVVFGGLLRKKNVSVVHINNPVINDDIEANALYLKKVEESMINVKSIILDTALSNELSDIKIIRAYKLLRQFHLLFIFDTIMYPFRKSIEKRLTKGNASLYWLDLYKLILLCHK